jgi:very-short-patch-repair endonuclease
MNAWGQPAVWPDAAYPQQRIALQYDGGHHADPGQARSDARRQGVTEQLGWREVRVFKEDLDGDKPFLLEKVKAAIRFRDERQSSTPTGT